MRDPYRRCPKSGTSEPHERHDRGPTDSGKPTMTADSESVAKHAALHPVHLDEQMSVTQLVQHLEALRFDSHERARVMIDPGVQAFLIRATKAAAADHLDAKVRHVWRSIKQPPR